MTKYVIDLPAETKVIVAKKPFLLNETDLMRIPVSQLELYVEPTVAEDAPVEKRVIELPADVIAELKTIKEDNGDDNLQVFMNDVNNDDELWDRVEEINFSGMPTDAFLGEWWLEHVKFVPKKDPEFQVIADSVYKPYFERYVIKSEEGKIGFSHKTQSDDGFIRRFTEAEADELVAGLSALNARKVKVEE